MGHLACVAPPGVTAPAAAMLLAAAPQHDVHIPLLTVLETLMFAYVCQQGFQEVREGR